MKKSDPIKPRREAKTVARDARTGEFIIGTTRDGVRILKPKGKATNFTQKELRDAITTVRSRKAQ